MRTIKSYNEFTNEEIDFKKVLIGGALIGGMGLGAYRLNQINKYAQLTETEVISGMRFKQYDVYINNKIFYLNFSEDGVISAKWSKSKGSGKNRKTVYYKTITVPNKTKEVWFYTEAFEVKNELFASIKPINGGKKLILSELDIIEETDTYVIYGTHMFSPVDHIVMEKGHTSGDEFTVQDRIGNWVCDKIGNNVYLFAFKNFGGGKYGGAGSGTTY
jgi:hypothetical protein